MLDHPGLDAMHIVHVGLQLILRLEKVRLAHVAFFLVLLLHVLPQNIGAVKLLFTDITHDEMILAQVPLQSSCIRKLLSTLRAWLSLMDILCVLLQVLEGSLAVLATVGGGHVYGDTTVVLAKLSTQSAGQLLHLCLLRLDTTPVLAEVFHKRSLLSTGGDHLRGNMVHQDMVQRF